MEVTADSLVTESRPRIGMTFYLGTMAALGPLAIDMYLPSFPTIAADFHVEPESIQRTLAAYFFGIAAGQLLYGPVSDRIGRKVPLYVGLALFAIASLACTFATSVNSLAALRLLQALGGCAEMVIARAIVRDRYSPKESAKLFGSLMLIMGIAPILAPLLGAFLADHLGWRAIFYVLFAAGLILLTSTHFFYAESLPEDRREKHTLVTVAQTYRYLLTHRLFLAHSLSVSFILTGLFAYVGGSPHLFLDLFHIPKTHFPLFFGPIALCIITASQFNAFLIDRFSMTSVLRFALGLSVAAGLTLLTVSLLNYNHLPALLIPLGLFMFSGGLIFPNASALAMAPHGRIAGNASAVMGSLQFGISALGGFLVTELQKHNNTTLPMTAVIAASTALALACNLMAPKSDLPNGTAESMAH